MRLIWFFKTDPQLQISAFTVRLSPTLTRQKYHGGRCYHIHSLFSASFVAAQKIVQSQKIDILEKIIWSVLWYGCIFVSLVIVRFYVLPFSETYRNISAVSERLLLSVFIPLMMVWMVNLGFHYRVRNRPNLPGKSVRETITYKLGLFIGSVLRKEGRK